MKEAYDVLSDPKKKQIYDALSPRGVKYALDPSSMLGQRVMLENLANSSFCDRTEIMALAVLVILLPLVQPILICSKVEQDLRGEGALASASWISVLIPLWIFNVVAFAALTYIFFTNDLLSSSLGPWWILAKVLTSFIAELFLALKWDGSLDRWSYAVVLIPVYVLEGLRCAEAVHGVWIARRDVGRMVAVPYLEKYVLPDELEKILEEARNKKKGDDQGDDDDNKEEDEEAAGGGNRYEDGALRPFRPYEDLTEEERDAVNERYIIVHSPPSPHDDDSDEESDNVDDEEDDALNDMEAYRLAMSSLFDALTML